MAMRADVVVVGGGAMGSAAAWWLARDGRSVVLLERFERGHARGSSHGPSRIFRLAYADPFYVRLAQQALPLWRELEADAGVSLLTTTGGIDHGPAEAIDVVADALQRSGASHELIGGEAAAERWPGMRFGEVVLFQPDAGRADADSTVRALQERAAAHGAIVRFDQGAAAIEARADDVLVRTDTDECRAPVAVVACGPWTPAVLAELARLPPMNVTREQVFYFASRSQVDWPAFIHHRRPYIYGLDTPGRGVKVAEHHTGATTDPDGRSFEVDRDGQARVQRYVQEWFPGVDPTPVGAETCLYTTTPTEDFVIRRAGPLVIAAGFSGHGFKFVPLVGRLLADLARGGSAPARFGLP